MSNLPHCFFSHLNSTASHSSLLIFKEKGAEMPTKVSSEKPNKEVGKAKETQETNKATSKSLDSLKKEVDEAKELAKKNDEKVRRYAATPKDSIAFIDKLIQACYKNYPMGKGEAEQFETRSERMQKEVVEQLKSSLDQLDREDKIRKFLQELIFVMPNFIAGVSPMGGEEENILSSVD